MTDASGTVTQRLAYDEYGKLTTPNAGEMFRYTGRRFDPETGLYYYRARYYSPDLGRFLQTDATGYRDDMDMYTYVGNNPMNRTDPSGLSDLNLFNNETREFSTFEQFNPKGWYSVTSHGGVSPGYEHNGFIQDQRLSHSNASKMMNYGADAAYKLFTANGYVKGTPIIVTGCNTERYGTFAERIAQLAQAPVVAAVGFTGPEISKDGNTITLHSTVDDVNGHLSGATSGFVMVAADGTKSPLISSIVYNVKTKALVLNFVQQKDSYISNSWFQNWIHSFLSK